MGGTGHLPRYPGVPTRVPQPNRLPGYGYPGTPVLGIPVHQRCSVSGTTSTRVLGIPTKAVFKALTTH
eukprot:1123602-Rhodomonas_salina.1